MNVLVLADALKAGGGVTIYNQFIDYLENHRDGNSYIIVINSNLQYPDIKNVKYIQIPLLSKFTRLMKGDKLLINELKAISFIPDVVVSLQNNGLRSMKEIRHVIYYHQPMPLYPGRWNPFLKRERSLFLYKYIYPYFIKRTWPDDTDFVVQIPFIGNQMSRKFCIDKNRIHLCFPDVETIYADQIQKYDYGDELSHFIYVVAGGLSSYKNIKTLIYAAKYIKEKIASKETPLKIHITTTAEYAKPYWELVKILGVENIIVFDGRYPHKTLLKLYKGATGLLFPSSIETLGLPLLEAAAFGLPIIAAEKDYAKEVLSDYEGVTYIDETKYERWAEEILRISETRHKFNPLIQIRQSSWNNFFELINKQSL